MINHVNKIILLNCPNAVDRLNFQKVQFKLYDLDYEIHYCEVVDKANGFMNKNIKSCYLSHIKMIEKIIGYNQMCLILEDDAVISTSVSSINLSLNAIINEQPEWDMIYLYRPSDDTTLISERFKYYSKIKYALNTHAYIINPTSLRKIHKALTTYYDFIDHSKTKYMTMCHIDRIYAHKLHEHLKIFSTNKNHFVQDKSFGSSLGWGWNNTQLIIDT